MRKPPSNRRRSDSPPRRPAGRTEEPTAGVRIIGGRFRGRKLYYSGDPRTRPMKDRLRESLFNRLGPAVAGKHAIDLFAGTGALGLEALSRGAARATLIERHNPTAEGIRRNMATLEVQEIAEVVNGDVFYWGRHRPDLGPGPWLVFSSPPYDFYVERLGDMMELLGGLLKAAPAGSIFAVESDDRFDFGVLPQPEQWDVRAMRPAVVGIYVVG